MHAFDRQTDRQTESLDRVCLPCSAVKIEQCRIASEDYYLDYGSTRATVQ